MLEDALSFPTRGQNGISRIIVGGLLVMFSWLIIPGLAAWGFVLRAMKDVSEGADEPTAFDDWGELIVDGIMAFVIGLVYALIPTVLYIIMFLFVLGGAQAGGDGGGILAGIGILGFIVALILFFVVQYILPAALINYARKDSFGAAFAFDDLKPVLLSNQYIIATLLVVAVVGIVLPVIVLTVGTITFGIGFILLGPIMPFLYFWTYLVGGYMFGRAFAEASGVETVGNVEEGEGVPA